MSDPIEPEAADPTTVARVVAMGMLPVAPLAALLVGGPLLPVLLASPLFAALGLIAVRVSPRSRPMLLAVSLIGHCIAFTAAFAGHRWQIDTHMLFFAMLAIVAMMSSIPALLLAVGVTAVHHLVLAVALPALVYPSADLSENLIRTVFHAAIVVFEAAVLLLSILQRARTAAEVSAARARLAESAEQAAAARMEAEAARERAVAAAERTRAEGQRAAAAVEQIAATSRSAADGSASARAVATRAREDAARSQAIVERATAAMKGIEDSAGQIGRIVTVIDEIARQTDLLALNAAVESARAGEAGRGFSVVAAEVRKLAQRSADATQQIRGLVTTSSHRVSEGAGLVVETGEALTRIATAVSDLDDLVGAIAAGAAQQSAGLAEVGIAISRIDDIAVDDGQTAPRPASADGGAMVARVRAAA
ncbi:methyl-accepting chemotaxis protein [Rhodobacter sp. CZR27]|uniref:methyl-accepting chemotaxis protein n=1 Tax=Rhodobacter sp. CZR27 TaxID=2033869 RepID=UPI000BBECE0D|nr:methyl-accepting chemotaxis protein [Rhodobacter sp. CZR27]